MRSFNLSEWALNHRSFVVYLMIVFIAAGTFAYLKLGRDEDPPYPFKVMVLKVYWPGATTDDMALQVTDRVEKKLQELPFLEYIRSQTEAGQVTVYVYLKESIDPALIPESWYQVRKKLGDLAQSFPEGTVGPFFDDEFGDTFGIVYAFTADGFTSRDLRDYVTDIRDRLLAVPNTHKIKIIGAQDERIYIEFDTKRLSGFGIDRNQAIESLRAQNAVLASGSVSTSNDRVVLRVSGGFSSARRVRDVSLHINGRFYRLADVATVRRDYVDPPQPSFRFNGEPAIGLAIAMSPGADILEFGRNVRRTLDEITADLPIGIEPHLVADQPIVVQNAVNHFMEALWAAIAIVLIVAFFSLGLRAGTVLALSIPLVLAIVFTAMDMAGIAFQRISLGALVISLGLLVDDAMITVEMMVRRLELGFDRVKAATHAYTATAFPMLTGTLVTIAGFLPIAFARSDSGNYMFSLFVVVAIALIVSWLVAVLFAPLLGVVILPRSLPRAAPDDRLGVVARVFRVALVWCLRHRASVITATLVLFALSVYGGTLIKQQFFPNSDRPELLVDLRLPQSASIYEMQSVVERFEKALQGDSNIERYSVHVGEGAPRFYLTLNVALPDEFVAQAVIVTTGLKAREAVRTRLDVVLAEDFPEVLGRVQPLQLGPLVEWPVQYRISGPTPETLRRLAYELSDIVAGASGSRNINFDWIEPIRAMRLRVDQAKARQIGISSADVARALNIVTNGATITQIRDSLYLIDLSVRATAADRSSLQAIRDLWLPLQDGRSVPLTDIASFEYGIERPVLWRRDRRPTITVQADVVPGQQAEAINQELAPAISQFVAKLPPGYTVAVGGTIEESEKALASVLLVVPAMLVVMLTILMVQLQSLSRLFLVLSVVPLGLIGIVAVMLPTGTPMGFVAMLGMIALAGMIIRNSVILIDQIGQNVTAGVPPWDAVVDATVHRFRPIVLTAAAAILGMLPIAREVFWGPMAFTIIGGLSGATLLTLIFLPTLYVAWFRIAEPDNYRASNRSPLSV